jgi:hypothetical protein
MAETPVFQGHHVIEQDAYKQSRLLRELSKQELFDLHAPRNLLNLPVDRALAEQLDLSPHPGGPLGEYSRGVREQLAELEQTPDGRAALRGDRAAAERVATRVGELTDTLKTGLVNGDLHSNTPQGMTREQANARIREFFGDIDGYRQTHATQIAEIGRMPGQEARWAGVTRSEGNVAATLDAIEEPGMKPMAGDPAAGRQSLGTAVAQANEAGRLPLSEPMEVRLRATFPQEMPPTLVRTPTMPEARGPLVEGGTVPDVDAPRTGAPSTGRALRVVGAAGVALMAYDFASTGHRVLELRAQGNDAAAEAAGTRFVGRNAGGLLVGFGAGFAYGATTGSWTGPGALVSGVIGGGVGAYLGEKWADQKQLEQIYTQTDVNGNAWTRDPADPQGAWLRTARAPNATGGFDETRLVAAGRLVDELNYRSANDSYSLGLANPPEPKAPFRLPAEPGVDSPRAPFETGRDYVRDAQSGKWQIEIRENLDGRIPLTRHEPVSDERAMELERQSALIIANNAANTPAVIAARYQIAHDQFAWGEFASKEPVPPVIRNSAAQTETLPASDGNTYTRGADGEWTRPGMLYGTNQASGNLREELNRTWQSQQSGLQELAEYAAIARANPTPTEYGLRNAVADAYGRAGVVRSDVDVDAATRAVAQDHARDGLGQSPYTLEVRPDGSIATLVGHDDRRMETKSVTTTEEIERARTEMTTSPHAIERPSEQDRDARAQAQREANLQGLSQDGSAQAVAATMRMASSGRRNDGAQEFDARDDDKRQVMPTNDRVESIAASTPVLPARLADPRDPNHPDHRLYQQIERGVAGIDAERGRTFDATSERLAMGAFHDAKAAGITSADHIAINETGKRQQDGSQIAAGTLLFVVQGQDPSDPAARRSMTDVAQAVDRPVEQSLQKVDTMAHQQAQMLAQAQNNPTQDDPGPKGPRMV